MGVLNGLNAIGRVGESLKKNKHFFKKKLGLALLVFAVFFCLFGFLLINPKQEKKTAQINVLPSPVEIAPTPTLEIISPIPTQTTAKSASVSATPTIDEASQVAKGCRRIPILMYHHVDDKSGSLYVRKDVFTKQMDYLIGKGYTTVTLQDVISGNLPSKPVVITFDDGYRDNYLNAYPILSQRRMKATIFVVTQLLGGGDFMSWDQAREMTGSSLITIGDHTLSHKSLPSLSPELMTNEIASSKNIIGEKIGATPNVFAYPYGNKNAAAEKILQDNGFIAAVTTVKGLVCPNLNYSLPRIRIGNGALSSYGL